MKSSIYSLLNKKLVQFSKNDLTLCMNVTFTEGPTFNMEWKQKGTSNLVYKYRHCARRITMYIGVALSQILHNLFLYIDTSQ